MPVEDRDLWDMYSSCAQAANPALLAVVSLQSAAKANASLVFALNLDVDVEAAAADSSEWSHEFRPYGLPSYSLMVRARWATSSGVDISRRKEGRNVL